MKQWKWFYMGVLFFFFSAHALANLDINDESSDFDFWWDYGEVDQKNATYAPAMDKEITRKTRVEVVVPEGRKVFVADEYLQIRYLLRVPFDVRINEKKPPPELTPFEIILIRFGQRRVINDERDMELQELLLTLRLAPSFPYDTYVLPSFDIDYQYDTVVGDSRIPQKDTVATGEILLEKVPVYVRVSQQRNTGFLWDIFPCQVEVHADNSVVLPNLDQDSGNDPLLQFKQDYPLMVQGQHRSEFSSTLYRVIRYEFMVTVQDFRSQPFTLRFPQIAWQHRGASPASKKSITPEPCIFFIQRITADTTRLSPMKKIIPVPLDERYWLLDLPRQILWALVVLGLFWISFLVWHHYRQREKIGKLPQAGRLVPLTSDRWPWRRLILGLQINKVRRNFQKSPGPKSCACLRELIARRSAMRLLDKKKLTTAEACALTAEELAHLGGRKRDIAELLQLDHQLESGQYDTLREKSPEGGK